MKVEIVLPNSWNELTLKQLKKIASICFNNETGIVFDNKVFLILLNIKWWQILKKRKAIIVKNNIAFTDLKKEYNWIYSTLNLTKFPNSIKLKKTKLFAPHDRLTNLNINEFAHLEDLYLGWHNTKNFDYLHYITAILYRENTNNKRTIFDKTELQKRSENLKNIDRKKLLAILLCYQGSRNYLTSQFPLVFHKPEKKKKTPQKSGFGKIILHLSGKKFGNYKETCNTNVYTFLSEFTEQLKTNPYA